MAAFIRFPVAAQRNGATAFDIGERTALLVQQRRGAADLAYGWRMESMRRKRLVFVPRSMLKI